MAVRTERVRTGAAPRGVVARLATETKQAFKTTEFWAMVAIVASAYIVSRGLAKAGSPEPYWADRDDLPGGSERD